MKILVTGGTGYIGSHTVVELQQQGYNVVIVDNLSNSHAGVVDRIAEITGKRPEFYNFDLIDREKTKTFFEICKDISGIIHFAAYKAVGESMNNPLMYYRNNLDSLINILQGMQDNGISNLVFHLHAPFTGNLMSCLCVKLHPLKKPGRLMETPNKCRSKF
jgi:UDP-glucose 4-epimerase